MGLAVTLVGASTSRAAPRTVAPKPAPCVAEAPELSALHRFETGAFYESVEDRERARTLGVLHGQVPLVGCASSPPFEGSAHLSLVLRGTLGDALEPFGRSRAAPVAMLLAYRRMTAAYSSCDRSSADFVDCERAHGAGDYAGLDATLRSSTPEQILGSPDLWAARSGLSTGDVGVLQRYHEALNAGSGVDAL